MANVVGLAKAIKDVASAIEPKQGQQVSVAVNQQTSVPNGLATFYPGRFPDDPNEAAKAYLWMINGDS